jgi:hypothetical protein
LTDAGETHTAPDQLFVVDPASCAILGTISKPIAMTGIDWGTNTLFATDGPNLYELTYSSQTGTFGNTTPIGATTTFLEDISLGNIPAAQAGKTTGGGQIPGKSNFGFVAQRKSTDSPPRGQLEFQDRTNGMTVHGTVDMTLTFGTDNSVTFSGHCTMRAPSGTTTNCTFEVHARDVKEPGRYNDTFKITYNGITRTGDPIIAGNIQVKTGS